MLDIVFSFIETRITHGFKVDALFKINFHLIHSQIEVAAG